MRLYPCCGAALLVAALIAGCLQPPPIRTGSPAEPRPYAIELKFSSSLADPYLIRAAPIEGRRLLPVNRWTEEALVRFASERSRPDAEHRLVLGVRLTSLAGRYRESGLAPHPGILDGLLIFGGGDSDVDIPAEIHKGVTLDARITLTADGAPLLLRELETSADSVVTPDDYDRRSYDFDELARVAIQALLREIDALLPEAL